MPWRDATSYEGLVPADPDALVWTLKNGPLQLSVWRHSKADEWRLNCPAFGIEGFFLRSPHVLIAQRQAIAHVKELAYKIYQSARGLTPAAKRKDKPA